MLAVQHLVLVLVVVLPPRALRPVDAAFRRLDDARGDAQQRALAAAVRPDQHHLLPALDVQVHIDQHHVIAVCVANLSEQEHVSFGAAVSRELKMHFRFFARALDPLDLRHGLLAALHGRGLRRFRAESLNEPLLLLDLPVLPRRRPVELLQPRRLLLLVFRVVAGVRLDDAVAQLEDAVRHAIEELRVVGDDQHDAPVLRQVVGQPRFRRHIQVVRRLVEQHVVRPPHQDLRQRDPHLPAAAERSAQLLAVAGREPQAVQHPPDPRIDAIAVHRFVRFEQPPLLIDERVEIAVAALDAPGDLVQLQVDGPRLRERRPHLVDETACRIMTDFLFQVAERPAPVPARALVGLVFSRDQPQERRLTGAVRADEPGAFALAHVEGGALEHVHAAKAADQLICI